MEKVYLLLSNEYIKAHILAYLYTKDIIILTKTSKMLHSYIPTQDIHSNIKGGGLNYKYRPSFCILFIRVKSYVSVKFSIPLNPLLFHSIKALAKELPIHFKEDIRKDTSRTFEIGFVGTTHGQEIFSSVIECLVLVDKNVGYCQGMNFVVGIFLNVYQDEERAYWSTLALFMKCKLHGLYKSGLPSLHIMNYQLQKLLESMLPKLYAHFRKIGMSIDYFTSKWIMTLFGCFLSFELLLPAIDNVIIDGWIGFYRIALGLFKILEAKLLIKDVVEISSYIKSIAREPIFDVNSFFEECKKVQIDNNVLSILENEYEIKEKELTKHIQLINNTRELNRKSIPSTPEIEHFRELISIIEKEMTDKSKMMANAQIQYEETKGEHDLLNDKLNMLKLTLEDLKRKLKKSKRKISLNLKEKKKDQLSLKDAIQIINTQIETLIQNIFTIKDEYISKVLMSTETKLRRH